MPPNPRSIFAAHNHRDQVHPVSVDRRLDSFQRHVTAVLSALATSPSSELLSLPWLLSLLDSFLQIQHQFDATLRSLNFVVDHRSTSLITNHCERTVKALDICTAVRDGIDRIRHWKVQAEIAITAVENSQTIRSKKSLADLTMMMMMQDSEQQPLLLAASPFRSFKQIKNNSASSSQLRSQSWSACRTWSAAKQLQAMAGSLNVPRGSSEAAGLAGMVYTVETVILFLMWVLVAAIPCQDRDTGMHVHFSVARGFSWSGPMLSMYDGVLEELKKRRGSTTTNGLMKEIGTIERCSRRMMESGDVREEVDELKAVCEGLKEGLETLERRVREVFHGIVKSRSQGLDYLRNNKQ